MTEFTAGNLTCRAKTMDGRKQFHVARRLAGLLQPLLALAETSDNSDMIKTAGAVGDALSSMPDETADYILDACLDAAEVKQDKGTGWAPLRVNGTAMYPLDMMAMMMVTWHVLQANLGGFTAALPQLGIPAAGQPQTSHG